MINRFKTNLKRVLKVAKKIYINLNSKHIKINPYEIFYQCNGKDDFLRYDMIVRLLAIENFYGMNDYGFNLYTKMQICRTGETWAQQAVPIFKKLIQSYKSSGYNADSEILLDSNLNLVDGSHRMALALFHNQKSISAKVLPSSVNVYYSIEWFKINGFTDDECKILYNRYKELCLKHKSYFVCTLWHPAKNFFDSITENLNLFGKIVSVKDYNFSPLYYKYFTRGIYYVDDIAKWKIEKKIQYMMKNVKENNCNMRVIVLELKVPHFRLKKTNNSSLSQACETIKAVIRNAYKNKIKDYFHDIIIHIGDNFYQNDHIMNLMNMPNLDLTGLFEKIKSFNYLITKLDSFYVPSKFPKEIALGKDLDIICYDEKNLLLIKSEILNYISVFNSSFTISIHEDSPSMGHIHRSRIRIELNGYLIFQFDLTCFLDKTKNNYLNTLISNKVSKSNFFVPEVADEILLRLIEIYKFPEKKHHKEFIQEHIDMLDRRRCDKYLDFNWSKLVTN